MMLGCTTTSPDGPRDSEHLGVAELRISADGLLAGAIDRVTVETGGATQDLVLNPFTGTFDASLVLSPGPHTLVVRAFSGAELVGESNTISVDVSTGVVTRVIARILDRRVDAPVYGPLFDSLTAPTTAEVGTPSTFSLSVVAPAGDPVTYAWTSDCADSTFSAPDAATTTWSKAADGSCRITVVAVSNGFGVAQSFSIVVFPAGTTNGAVNLNGVFIAAPAVQLTMQNLGCGSFSGAFQNSSCGSTIASPAITSYTLNVNGWGLSTPGSLVLTDSCDGRTGVDFRNSDFVSGSWLPPVNGGLCILTALAINGDGVVGSTSIALLARAGTPATAAPPQVFAQLDSICFFGNSNTVCPGLAAGGTRNLTASVSWGDGTPGTVTVTDTCGGGQFHPGSSNFFQAAWPVDGGPGRACETTIEAVNLQGVVSVAVAQYQLF